LFAQQQEEKVITTWMPKKCFAYTTPLFPYFLSSSVVSSDAVPSKVVLSSGNSRPEMFRAKEINVDLRRCSFFRRSPKILVIIHLIHEQLVAILLGENQCAQKSNYLIDSSINQDGLTSQSIKSSLV
jgi:hypothetical protein